MQFVILQLLTSIYQKKKKKKHATFKLCSFSRDVIRCFEILPNFENLLKLRF